MAIRQVEVPVEFRIYSLEWALSAKETDNAIIEQAIGMLNKAKEELDPEVKSGIVSDAYSLLEDTCNFEYENPEWVSYITSLDSNGEAELDYAKISASKYFIEIVHSDLYVAGPFNTESGLSDLVEQAEIPVGGNRNIILNAFTSVSNGENEKNGAFALLEDVQYSSAFRNFAIIFSGMVGLAAGGILGGYLPVGLDDIANVIQQYGQTDAAPALHNAAEFLNNKVAIFNYGTIFGGALGALIVVSKSARAEQNPYSK